MSTTCEVSVASNKRRTKPTMFMYSYFLSMHGRFGVINDNADLLFRRVGVRIACQGAKDDPLMKGSVLASIDLEK